MQATPSSVDVLDSKGQHHEIEYAETEAIPRRLFYEPENEEERRLDKVINLKLDICVVFILSLNFILCGIDKTNIGYAATTSFIKDAHLHPDDIGNAVSLLFVTFVVLQPVSTAMGRRIGPKYWISILMVCWGTVCMAHAATNSRASLIALRLLLGAAESGFGPTSFYYMSTVYPKFSLGFRLGLFAGMFSLAGAFAGLIAYGIFHLDSPHLKSWQILFIIEGALSVAMAAISLLILPARLESAWFLSIQERKHAVSRMERDLGQSGPLLSPDMHTSEKATITKRDVLDAVTDWRKLLTVVCNILATIPVSAFTTFMPLIVQGLGYHGVKASLMSVSPFAAGTLGLLFFVTSSDYFKDRSIHTAASMLLSLVGLIVMYASKNPKLRYVFTHVCLTGAFCAGPLVVAWLAGNTPEKGTRSIVIGINGWSNIAGVIAGQLYKARYGPSYKFPLLVTMILLAVGILGFLAIRLVYMYINRQRERKTSTWTETDFRVEQQSWARRGDQKYSFRYGY